MSKRALELMQCGRLPQNRPPCIAPVMALQATTVSQSLDVLQSCLDFTRSIGSFAILRMNRSQCLCVAGDQRAEQRSEPRHTGETHAGKYAYAVFTPNRLLCNAHHFLHHFDVGCSCGHALTAHLAS